jgi:protein-disulfide isomerase
MTSGARPPETTDRRAEARQARLDREQADASAAARRRRLRLLGGIVAVALVVVGAAIALTSGGGGGGGGGGATTSPSGGTGASAAVAGVSQTRTLLSGIPQRDTVLGRPSAPVRVIEFADPQCPFCRDFALKNLPALVRGPVRDGRVQLEYRALAFIGPDSVKAARFVEAAALQNRLWYATELLYANQGAENSGWVTDGLLRAIAAAIPGLDAGRALAAAGSSQVTARLRADQRLADQHGVSSTPTFLVGRGNALKAVGADGLTAALQAALKAS